MPLCCHGYSISQIEGCDPFESRFITLARAIGFGNIMSHRAIPKGFFGWVKTRHMLSPLT